MCKNAALLPSVRCLRATPPRRLDPAFSTPGIIRVLQQTTRRRHPRRQQRRLGACVKDHGVLLLRREAPPRARDLNVGKFRRVAAPLNLPRPAAPPLQRLVRARTCSEAVNLEAGGAVSRSRAQPAEEPRRAPSDVDVSCHETRRSRQRPSRAGAEPAGAARDPAAFAAPVRGTARAKHPIASGATVSLTGAGRLQLTPQTARVPPGRGPLPFQRSRSRRLGRDACQPAASASVSLTSSPLTSTTRGPRRASPAAVATR